MLSGAIFKIHLIVGPSCDPSWYPGDVIAGFVADFASLLINSPSCFHKCLERLGHLHLKLISIRWKVGNRRKFGLVSYNLYAVFSKSA